MCLPFGHTKTHACPCFYRSWTTTTRQLNWSAQEVTFLDTRVCIENERVETDLHVKLTSRHQYLHTKSCHPKHCKTSVIKRNCSERENLVLRTRQLKHHLSKTGYSDQLLDSEINQAFNTSHCSSSSRSNWWNSNRVPLVVMYHPSGRSRKFERGQRSQLNRRGFTTPINYNVHLLTRVRALIVRRHSLTSRSCILLCSRILVYNWTWSNVATGTTLRCLRYEERKKGGGAKQGAIVPLAP